MNKSKRIEDLNKKNEYRLEKGVYNRGLGAFKYVNNHLKYFLITGVVLFLMQGTSSINATGVEDGINIGGLAVTIPILIITLLLLIALTGFKLKVNRAIGEKMADSELDIRDSSFFDRWDMQLFTLGVKNTVSQIIIGLVLGIVLFIFFFGLGFIGAIFVGSTGSLGEALGLAAVYLIMFTILVLIMSVVITPFILPVEMIYTFYGEDIGIFEAIKMSFSIGWNNYGKLFVLGLKVLGLTLLGTVMIIVGLIYTLPIAQYMVIETFSEIFGVKIVRDREADFIVEVEDVEVGVVKEANGNVIEEAEEIEIEVEEVELEEEELEDDEIEE